MGRHPLPSPEDVERAAARWSVRPDSVVVAYDDNGGMSAARAWWLLRWIGHQRVHVLDGGLQAWRAAGGPETTTETEPSDVEPPPPGDRGSMPTVDCRRHREGRVDVLLDARARPSGSGARASPSILSPGTSPAPSAPRRLTTSPPTAGSSRPTSCAPASRVSACGRASGSPCTAAAEFSAAHEILALELAGIRASLYPASWSGWIADPDHPVATGDD